MTLLSISEDFCSNPYIPGLSEKLGANVTIINVAEPAYGFKVNLTLPAAPIRVPSLCNLNELNMTCKIPSPLHRNEKFTWLIELEFIQNSTDEFEMYLLAQLSEPPELQSKNSVTMKELILKISPRSNITVKG